MRILHIIATMDPRWGGPPEAVRQLTRALAAQGHASEVASVDAPDRPWVRESPCALHALGPAAGRYRYSKRLAPWLRAHAGRFDCALVHGLWRYSSVAGRRALRHSGTPYFVYPHGGLDPWFRAAGPLKHAAKALYWRLAEGRVLRDARLVLFTCERERLRAGRAFRPYRCREAIVPLGVAPPGGDPEAQRRAFLGRFPELSGRRLLLFLGRLHPVKGCDLLIEAFAGVARDDPSAHLVMAGPDEAGWRAELHRRAEALGAGRRVTWTGLLAGDLKWGAFRAADAFVLPSHTENFGIAAAEALALGVPALVSDQVGIARAIEADGAGLVAGDHLEGTGRLLRAWLTLPPEARQAMREDARRCFRERFEAGRAAARLARTLRDAVAAPPPRPAADPRAHPIALRMTYEV